MNITLFEISEDRSKINLTITDAAETTSLLIWTSDNYKDYSKAINLSSKLNGEFNQDITISPNDLSQAYFDGVYFVEVYDSTLYASAVTAELARYKECILAKLLSTIPNSGCLEVRNDSLINAQTLLLSLEDALEHAFIDEIMIIIKALNLYCSNDCKSCKEYAPIINPNYYSSNGA